MQQFLEDHSARLYRFALRLTGDAHTAEDLTQESLLRAWRRRDQLRNDGAARVWLFRIAVNVWKDEQRRPANRRTSELMDTESKEASPEQKTIAREDLQQALDAMDSLPEQQRMVLFLSVIEGLAHAEIADVLESSPSSVKVSLSKARRTMRMRLQDLCPNEPMAKQQ